MHEARELEAARSAGSRRRVALLLAAAALCAGCQRESPAQALRARFPDQAERLARLPGFAASGDGFERALRPGDGPAQVDPVRAAEAALAQRAAGPLLRLPARGGDRAVLTLAGGLEVRIVERGASGAGTLEGSTVAYRRAGGGAFWSAGADHVEEWILTDAAGDGPVAEWEVAGATLRQRGDAVELLDGAGQVRGRVVAPVAWRPDGSEARAWLRAERGVLALHTEARGMALVDPVWLSVDAPLHWHRSGTATLLPTGKVLLTGGIDAGLVEELFDPAVGAWTSTGHLNVNRSGHSATVLRNGKVLVLGGYAGTAAELFDPATQTWSYTGATLHWRTWHSATLLASGKVLVAGGVNASGGATNAAELYDPATETWAPTGAMASARSFHTATLLPDSRVLVTGGGVSTAELYDPATGTWSPGGSLPEVRSEHSATLLADGRVLISQAAPLLYDYTLGAFSPAPATLTPQAFPVTALLPTGAALSVESTWTTSADAEVFDPVAGTWTAAGSRSTSYVARPWSAATPMVVPLPDGRVFLAGYGSFGGAATFGAELYDPSVPFLAPAAPLATARSRHTVTLLSTGKVLVAGGFDGAGNATASAELYDPATGLFAPTGSLGTARGFHTATTLASGKVLLAGGRTAASGTPVSSAELYDPSLGTFTAAAGALQGARSAHSSTLLGDGRVLLAGGLDASGAVASAELFEPAGTFTTTGSLRAARAQHAAVLVGSGKVRLLGGAGPGGPLASVEEYDPATGQFAIHSTLVSARSAAGATLLGGGAILVTGGDGGAGYLATAELYPAGLGAAWTLTGSMSTGRASHTATLLPSGKVLVAGGQTLSGATAAAELYDPVSGLWDPPLTLSTARYAHGAAVLPSGRVLLAGGANPATLASAELLDEGRGAPPSRAPSITAASSPAGAGTVAAGGALGLAGTRFTGVSEAGPSQPGSSPTNFPLVSLERADGGPPAYAPLTAFGASSATGTVPRSVLPGPYWARVTVSGVPSNPVLVRVTPPLAITPGNAISPPRGTVVFTTTGGSGGAVTWRVASGPSGGRVDASTLQPGAGVYVAGTAGNVTDVVQATDAHGNVATAMIAVTGPVAIGPATAAVPPRGVIAFSATGGSGTGWDWTLQTNLSGATLGRGTGAYVAGATGSVADVVLVTDALGNAATRTVTVGPGITITASPGTTTVSPRGTLTFSASGGQGSGYAWTLSTNASGGTVDASGVYVAGPVGSVNDVVTATDPLGNVATFTVEVSAPVTLTPAGLDTTPGGSRQFTASGGSGTGWSWSLAANGSSGSLTPSTGYYTAYATYRAGATGNSVDVVQVTDSLGNRAAATIRVGAGVSVTPAAASVQVGRTVALRASGGNGSYAWAVDPPNAAGGWVWYEGTYTAGQVPGTDVVRVHDGNQSAATATITVVPTLVVSPAAPTVVARTAQRFTAAGGQPPHRWSVLPGGTSGGTIDPSGVYTAGASAGADTVQVEDALGNTATAAVTVQAPLLIAPKATGVAVNGTVTFGASGGSGTGYAFQLASSGSGSPSLLSSGTYTAGATPGIDVVRVTDSSGNADTATVTVVPVLTAAASAASVPPRGAATFTASGGSGGGYRFDWPPGGNASGATLTSDGRYRAGAAGTVTDTVRVTDGAGATATRTIAVGPSVGVSAVAATVPPGGATDLLASGGGPGPFRWTIRVNRSGGTVDGSSGHYVAGRTGSVPDVVQAEDSLGNVGTCAVSVGAGVTISPPGATVVPGGRFDFTATGGSGTGFAWSLRTAGSGGARVAQNGAYVAGAAGGALDVVAVDDSLGNVGTVAVTVNPALVIVPDTAAVVPRASRDFLAGGGFGAPFTYAADAQSGGLASGGAITADGRYTAGPVGSVVDHVKVTDARGTVARAEIRVLPAVTITPAAPVVAPGEVVDLVALGGSNQGWTWTPTGPTVSGGTVGAGGRYQAGPGGGTAGTTDTISVTDSLGNWAQVQVTVGPVLSVTPGATRVAANGTRTFTAAGGKPPYRWDVLPDGAGGSVAAADATATFTPAAGNGGSATLRVRDALGQEATAQIAIAPLLAVVPATPSAPPRGRLTFSASGGAGGPWTWALTGGSGGSIEAETGRYVAGAAGGTVDVVEVTDSAGASVSVSVTVTAGITVSPADARVDPGGELTLSARGGSGAGFAWELVTNASDGTVDAGGHYRAGKVGGAVDVLRVRDSLGNEAQVKVRLGTLDVLSCATGGGAGLWGLAALLLAGARRGRRRGGARAVAALLCLALPAAGAAAAAPAAGTPATASPAAATPAAAPAPTPQGAAKTAVLEFTAGPGTDTQIARLATDAMTTVLQAAAGVPIISERDVQTSLSYDRKRKATTAGLDARDELGMALGMDVIVYGTVSRIGQTHVLSAQVVDVKKGAVLTRFQRRSAALTDESLLELVEQAGEVLAPFLPGSRAVLPIGAQLPGGEVPVPDPSPPERGLARRTPWPSSEGAATRGVALPREPSLLLPAEAESQAEVGLFTAARQATDGKGLLTGLDVGYRASDRWALAAGLLLGGQEWLGGSAGVALRFLDHRWRVRPVVGLRAAGLAGPTALFGAVASGGVELRLGRFALAVEASWLKLVQPPKATRDSWVLGGGSIVWRP